MCKYLEARLAEGRRRIFQIDIEMAVDDAAAMGLMRPATLH